MALLVALIRVVLPTAKFPFFDTCQSHRPRGWPQVLAYSTLSETSKITSCLVYPCQKHTWESLKKRGMLYHRAALNAGRRSVNLVLMAIPMESEIEEMVQMLAAAVN